MADTYRYKRIRLETVSESSSNVSDTESVYSTQGRETELARDTSDTSDTFEFEVQDIPDSQNVFLSSSEDPDIEDIAELGAVVARLAYGDSNFDIASQADTSEENSTSPTSNSDVDPELPRSDYLDFQHCLICKTEDKDISYPYCTKCFKNKKNFFPPRPGKKKRKKRVMRTLDLGNDKKSVSGSMSDGGKSSSAGSGTKFSSQESSFDEGSDDKTLCKTCCVKKMDGVFVHGSTGHMHSCFQCAKKTWKNIGVCPLCRKRCKDVIKLYNPFDKD